MPSLVPELSVLKPIDPSISHSDEYEIFTLVNATVCYQNGREKGKQASLLAAYADIPLRVQGRLEGIERGQAKYLAKRPFKPVDVEIRNVTRFSYGQTQDGEIVIWALGEAGWFELRPSRAYSNSFQNMMQAVECLYFITDIYSEAPQKRGGGPSAQLIFQEYAEDERFEVNDIEEVEKVFGKHRMFLIVCFLNKAQGIGWSGTPLYQYFKKKFPKDWETARARIDGKYTEKEEKAPKKEPVAARSSGTGKKKIEDKTSYAPKKDDNWWEAAAIFEFMQKAVNQGAMHVGRITLGRLAKLIVRRYEIEEIETAQNVILVHASNLCYIMDHPRRKSIRYFASEPIYEELSAGHSLSTAEARRAESIKLRRRKNHATLKEDLTTSESESESEPNIDIETPQRRPSRRKGRLSVLRPKSSKYSGKSKGKGVKGRSGKGKGKAPNLIVETDSESDEEMVSGEANGSESDEQIDTPTQAFSPGKRKHAEDVEDINPKKRAASASASEEPSPSSPPISSPSTPSSVEADASNEPLPLRWRSGNATSKSSNSALLPPIVSSPLPTYTANGPGDSWICSFDGCPQKIYGVSSELGRRLVKEHLQDHANGREQVVSIILREEEKCRLPVNNLIKRIREMSELQQPLFPSVGPAGKAIHPTPQSIERTI